MTFHRILLCALALPLATLAQWPQPVQTIGNVTSNDPVVFADSSGRYIKAGTNSVTYLQSPTNSAGSGWYLIYGINGIPQWTPDPFTSHIAETNAAHGGIMRSASNPGDNGQVLFLNKSTGRPYWGDPVIEGGNQYLLTSGVARVNGRYATTNYTVAVTNGTWDGTTAILTPTGSLTIVSSEPLSRWEYDNTLANGIGLTDLIDTGSWTTNEHGLLTVGDIYSVKIDACVESVAPSPGGETDESITISNLAIWTWGESGIVGSTNEFQGTKVMVDDPVDSLDAVNLQTLIAQIAGIAPSASQWANYDAAGNANSLDGVNMGGRRVYLDSQWSLFGNGAYCALSYNGKDIFYVSMSNRLLAISNINVGSIITINVSTNGVTSRPWIEWTSDLTDGNWLEITNATSTYPVKTNGAYILTFSNIWDTAFFRAVQGSSNVNALVSTIPINAQGGITLGGVTRTNWPTPVPGPQGIPGPSGSSSTNIMTMTITNITMGGGGVGSFTNVQINGVNNTNGVMFGDSASTTWTCGTDGVWRVNSWSSNGLDWVVGGEHIGSVSNNGITLYQGSLQLFEEDLNCNVRLYDGSRLAPSLTFLGHTNEWGLYARGYNGNYVAGWSVAGAEVGLLHAGGITLMDTNFAFTGRVVGDLSGCSGYPEPVFEAWRTNMQFSILTLSNLVVTPGGIQVKDALNVNRLTLNTTGMEVLDAGGISRSTLGTDLRIKDTSGLTTMVLDDGLTTYDALSGQPIISLDNWTISIGTADGYNAVYLNPSLGLKFTDPYQHVFRTSLGYDNLTMWSPSSQLVFSVDSQVSRKTIINDVAITNSGNLMFHGVNGTNLCTITGATGAIKIRGTDSDTRYVLVNTNWYSGIKTNLDLFGKTNIWKYQYGSVTQNVVL